MFVLCLLLLGTTGSFSVLPDGVRSGLVVAPAPGPIVGAHVFPTPIHHVFVIVLEDATRTSVLSSAPFERQLATRFASSSQFDALCHPSAPNYLAISSGNALQCGSDGYASYATENLGDLAQKAGISWGAFMESMPTACNATDAYPYTVSHNPFVFYSDLRNRPSACAAHDLPLTSWATDVAQGTIPAFGFFSPNLQHDGHDTGVASADQWLAGWLSPLMNESFFASSVFFVTYDEAVGSSPGANATTGGSVYFAAVSPFARSGFLDTQMESPYTLYATAAWLLGLPTPSSVANLYVPMKQLFRFSGTLPTLLAHGAGSPLTGLAPLTTNFNGTATGGTAPYSFAWNFGDGATSSLASPSHQYTHVGTFLANLTVTDAAALRSTSVVTVVVSSLVAGVNATLTAGAQVATVPSTFWSVAAQTASATGIWTSAAVKSFLNATPFVWLRYGAGTDACNISTDTSYSSGGVASHGCAFNLTALKDWCAVTSPCHTILDLPGENNNSAEDAAIANWTVATLGFQPDYWTIGNEPTGWTHYGIPWTQWKSTDSSSPSAVAYAFDVKAAIAAVKAVDPAAKFIGIEAACSCNTAWFPAVAKVDGPNISAIAYHSYPSTGSTTVTLPQFYAPLSGKSNLSSTYSAVRGMIKSSCSTCATMPIFVNEYNAGPGWAPSNYGGSYANAVFLAASIAQALRANVSQLTLFDLQTGSSSGFGFSMMNAKGTVAPTGTLFTNLAPKIADGAVYATGITSTMPGLWSVLTENATAESLLVVNTNLTQTAALDLGTVFPTAVAGEADLWSPTSTAAPNSTVGLIASAYSVPAQGVLLLVVPLVNGVPLAPLASGGAAHSPVSVVAATSAFPLGAPFATGLVAIGVLARPTATATRRMAA